MSAVKLIPASGGGSVSLSPPSSTSGADVTVTLPSASQGLGKILQVLQNLKRDTSSSSSTTYVDTGLSQAITPSSTTNKILIQYSIMFSAPGSAIPSSFTQIVRGSTALTGAFPTDTSGQYGTTTAYSATDRSSWTTMTYLDSPNTTSSTTYKIQYRVDGGSAVHINKYHGLDNYKCISHLTLMEVAA